MDSTADLALPSKEAFVAGEETVYKLSKFNASEAFFFPASASITVSAPAFIFANRSALNDFL